MKKENNFTSEQLSDAERLLNELVKVPENKRSFIVTVMTAYMNGIETGFAYNTRKYMLSTTMWAGAGVMSLLHYDNLSLGFIYISA